MPRSYSIGIETTMPAVPGMKPPLKALTVVPFGMEEGGGHHIKDRRFALRIGERARFRLFQSTERKQDAPGEMLDEITAEMEELAPVEVSLPGNPGETVPVTLESLVTETGMMIHQIAAEVEGGAQANVQMAAAAQQQTLGMQQIAQAMTAIQQAMRQTLLGTRQTEQAAQGLLTLAQLLQHAIAVYRM